MASRTKLTWEDVKFIRLFHRHKLRTRSQLAKEFKVTKQNIINIIAGVSWSDPDDPGIVDEVDASSRLERANSVRAVNFLENIERMERHGDGRLTIWMKEGVPEETARPVHRDVVIPVDGRDERITWIRQEFTTIQDEYGFTKRQWVCHCVINQ